MSNDTMNKTARPTRNLKALRKLYASNGDSMQYRIDRATLGVLDEVAKALTDKVNILPSHALVIRRAVRVCLRMLKDGRVNLDREPLSLLEAVRGL
jgi:hypothetical protein